MQHSPVNFYPSELAHFAMPEAARSYDWVSKNLRVVAGPYKKQLWTPAVSPFAEAIMDILDNDLVRKLFYIASSQSTKTTTVQGWMLSRLMNRLDNVGYGMPDESAVRRMFTKTLHEYFKLCPSLRKKLKGVDALQNAEIQLTGGASIIGMWAGSDSRARSFSAPIVIVDEEDSFQDKSAVLAQEERADAYDALMMSKRIRLCRPKGNEDESTIWRDAKAEADVWLYPGAKCPACNAVQVMEHHNIEAIDGSRDPKRIRKEKLARYRCEHCSYRWTDQARNQALVNGHLVETSGALEGAASVAVHVRQWESPLVSLSDVLALWFEAQQEPRKMQKFDNNVCAKPYKFVQIKQDETDLEGLVSGTLGVGVVPDWALCLTLAADMQKDHFKYSVCAHGIPHAEHIVDYGKVSTFAELEQLIFESRYQMQDGRTLGIWRAAVDTGGGKNKYENTTRTAQCYEWLLSLPRGIVFGTKGMSRKRAGVYVHRTELDKMPNGRIIRGGLPLHFLDTDMFKRLIFHRLAGSEGEEDMQPISFHAQTSAEYLKEIASEELEKRKNGEEVWVRKRANHWLDCLVSHVALVYWQWKPSFAELADTMAQPAPIEPVAVEQQKIADNPFTEGLNLFGGSHG
ncbi:MAG: phage terminase large subunit family protein [Desulfovibrionales bacterium]|nr:phage terminase large subunit family protein [Desulfovibrionales bacterium]